MPRSALAPFLLSVLLMGPFASGAAAAGTPATAEAPLARARAHVAAWLETLDRPADEAAAAAARLTADDLRVLLANPRMLRRAGSPTDEAILWGVLIIAAIVLLAVFGSGSVSIS